MSRPTSAEIRESLDHPVIDADGHTIEFAPALEPYVREEGITHGTFGLLGADGPYTRLGHTASITPEERRRWHIPREPWWVVAADARDYATATLPRLFYDRLDEFGIDFAVLYPTAGILALHLDDEQLRRRLCRAINRYHADAFAEVGDRIRGVALIPAHTPAEAIEAVDHAVGELGFHNILIPGYVKRPIVGALERDPQAGRYAYWFDTYGVDSEYDYDPFWARCAELRLVVATHSVGFGLGHRQSTTNWMYNQAGHFATAQDAVCKSMFMGGVTHRFPELRFAFLEGGVAWACALYADMVGLWQKRNGTAVRQYSPARFDRTLFSELVDQHGGAMFAGKVAAEPPLDPARWEDDHRDDWEAVGIKKEEDIRDRFVPNFYFGCEADDPFVGLAFDSSSNPFGARLNAMFSSDIGHWDVTDAAAVLGEAWGLVEKEQLDRAEFRDFTFANAVRLYGEVDPDYFVGTVLEQEAAAVLRVPVDCSPGVVAGSKQEDRT